MGLSEEQRRHEELVGYLKAIRGALWVTALAGVVLVALCMDLINTIVTGSSFFFGG